MKSLHPNCRLSSRSAHQKWPLFVSTSTVTSSPIIRSASSLTQGQLSQQTALSEPPALLSGTKPPGEPQASRNSVYKAPREAFGTGAVRETNNSSTEGEPSSSSKLPGNTSIPGEERNHNSQSKLFRDQLLGEPDAIIPGHRKNPNIYQVMKQRMNNAQTRNSLPAGADSDHMLYELQDLKSSFSEGMRELAGDLRRVYQREDVEDRESQQFNKLGERLWSYVFLDNIINAPPDLGGIKVSVHQVRIFCLFGRLM